VSWIAPLTSANQTATLHHPVDQKGPKQHKITNTPFPNPAKPSTSENFVPASTTAMAGHEQDINPTKKGSGMSSQGTAGKGSEESMADKVKSKLGM